MDFQDEIKALLEGDESLAKAGCTVVCADELDVVNTIERTLAALGGILVLVNVPEIERDGCAADAIPCRCSLSVQCVEMPALRGNRGSTALAAACRVAALLDGAKYNFVSIRQTSDERLGTLTATATFNSILSLEV